ncbi:hypothetical protein PLESTB_001209700 [Pleodorina starrii]|uniref:Homogentisate solanesyltransferase n=1 Tax=Pleodorina starrii TaxID=330485 RepID=A0A9W6BRZ9_9CHLO|nr:hypothetical protein PLESTM_001649400 [Pleodorina starrii]GLC57304.1 hypothetical protein PLESTB_001209700 [Pleodorina starrii]GLC71297.1 hypothetical protein PLESTF_001100300 [Pleodorina starrii]
MDLCSTTGRGLSISSASTSRQGFPAFLSRGGRVACVSAPRAARRQLFVASSAASVPAPGSGDGSSLAQKVASFPSAFWKFLRPHTIRGTILGTTAVTAKALLENPQCIDWALLPRALLGLVALLCGNGYIVGINQIYDVDIDVVNKPFLPVASGELSPALAWGLCLTLAATGVSVVASNFGSVITSLYTFGLFLGTIYSVPPLRLKQYAVPAFLIIATVRGFLLNFGVYSATRAALGLPFEWSPAISFITVFVTVFATVIAITKDLPDVEGDQANNITTFATRMGVRNVALLAIGLLFANYVGAVGLALSYSAAFNVPLMAGAHAVLGCVLLLRTLKLHTANYTREAVASFYRWIWNLFYAEYALLPFL